MPSAHIAGIDLNLLPVLDALLRERHVSRAALRVGLSQPAVSRALGRLRALLGDPLLVRKAGVLVLTPRAEALREPVQGALATIEGAISSPGPFDPGRARRTVRIASDDYCELVVLAPLLARIGGAAPGFDVRVVAAGDTGMERLARGDVDFYFAPVGMGEKLAPGVRAEGLGDDRFVSMVSRHHPLARDDKPSLAAFLRARHALIAPSGDSTGLVDRALRVLGKERRVALVLPHFMVMPFFVASSDLVVTLAERIARVYAAVLPVILFRPPLRVPGFTTGFFWHQRDVQDPALAWFRGQALACRAVLGAAGTRRRRQRRIEIPVAAKVTASMPADQGASPSPSPSASGGGAGSGSARRRRMRRSRTSSTRKR